MIHHKDDYAHFYMTTLTRLLDKNRVWSVSELIFSSLAFEIAKK